MSSISPKERHAISEAKNALREREAEDDIRGFLRDLAFAYFRAGDTEPITEYVHQPSGENELKGFVKSVRHAARIALEDPLQKSVYISHVATSEWQPRLPTLEELQQPHRLRSDETLLPDSESLLLKFGHWARSQFTILSNDAAERVSDPHSVANSMLLLPDDPVYIKDFDLSSPRVPRRNS
ncbi:MAG: hypothetical protein U0524_00925 [Candidatus Saccharimonadales bacterium]